MLLQLPGKNLEVYSLAKKLVFACYDITQELPEEEKNNLRFQIRSAALSAYLYVTQAAFQKRKRRKRFLRKAKDNLIIIDAALELLVKFNTIQKEQMDAVESSFKPCYRLIRKLLKK